MIFSGMGWIIGEPVSTQYYNAGLLATSAFACTVEPMNKSPVTDTFISIVPFFSNDCASSEDGGQSSTSNFRSDHPGGCNFLFVDGSVGFECRRVSRICVSESESKAGLPVKSS